MDCKVEEKKQLTLDEAIAHAEERVNDTPCGRLHKQLADWMKELRELRRTPLYNVAALRETLSLIIELTEHDNEDYGSPAVRECLDTLTRIRVVADLNLSVPARNCELFGGDKEKLHAKWWEWSGTKEGQNSDGTVKLTFGDWLLVDAE